MAYNILFSRRADRELDQLRAFDRRRLVDEIVRQLTHTPDVETRNRKRLRSGLVLGFETIADPWQLRVGQWRVFYDMDVATQRVYVQAVRRKRPDQTTQEIAR